MTLKDWWIELVLCHYGLYSSGGFTKLVLQGQHDASCAFVVLTLQGCMNAALVSNLPGLYSSIMMTNGASVLKCYGSGEYLNSSEGLG